jgi:hypothetical protein
VAIRLKTFVGAKAILLLALSLLVAFPSPSVARDPLRCEMKIVSEKLRDYFAGRRVKEIAVGDVANADPTTPSSAGPGIRQLLIDELQRAELKVKLRAPVGLSVSYRARKIPKPNDRSTQQLVVEMRFTATFTVDNSQEDVLSYRVGDDEANRHILGVSSGPQTLVGFDQPKANIDGTTVLAGDKAPFGVEILVDGQPLMPRDEDGFGLVSLTRDQTYAVRLVNRAPYEVAVRLSIDGINMFQFSEIRQKDGPYAGAPAYDMVLVPPTGTLVIPGWHRTNKTSAKFKITEYAETAAAKMNKSTDIGTIVATFCAAWEKTPPPGEPDGARGPGDDGTGFGEDTRMNYAAVRRTVGAVRGSVAVRYRVPPSPSSR